MIASWKNCFEEELLCPICLNVFEEPVQLPCKHNFCKNCICEAWAKDGTAVRCPECNHDYDPKPTLEKNFKLANIVKRFNALNAEKAPAMLHCVLCRRGPSLPVLKVCLRCKEPCCQSHIHTHLQQPCAAPGHLLVDAEELSAWTCPSHEEYRVLHCEEEQVALCAFCCMSHCTNQRHTVCDVETQRIQMQAMLMKQEDQLEDRVQNIDEQLSKLDSDKTRIKEAVCQLKERVRAQYQRMQVLMELTQTETMQMLESTYRSYVRNNSQQVVQLNEMRHKAAKLLCSLQTVIQRSHSINFMKNTKPYQLIMNRSHSHLSCAIPPLRVGQLSCHQFLSELLSREKNLRKILDVRVSEGSVLELVQPHCSSVNMQTGSSGLHKRKYSMAFLDKNTELASSRDPSSLLYNSKKPFLSDQTHNAMYSGDSLSQNPHTGPSQRQLLVTSSHRRVALGTSSTHHSGTVFPPSHFPSGSASQPTTMFEGRKVLVCALNNCCCSGAAPASTGPTYTPPEQFSSLSSQDFSHHSSIPVSQPLHHFTMQSLMNTPQANRQTDFYGLYGQSSTKHYGNK
ncbi:E3 ubiquitin-protein ligase TRIM8-like [Boleophthalmus pectinirostris]|uniref:E3 ubiquitin-protein ligase TRIM8-like n=1 Tax=Boleophthalmus pectinirostris TaxID=150288 RepID=UPI00242B743A|nr:E3 ubiquitin-protein ligase TRIM8-like [Boleophthalmus pectinirostris]XP_055021449.1 E3 ubiquitin-protein ligase TRIM8-like [Boleophthalmus pectinirostris]